MPSFTTTYLLTYWHATEKRCLCPTQAHGRRLGAGTVLYCRRRRACRYSCRFHLYSTCGREYLVVLGRYPFLRSVLYCTSSTSSAEVIDINDKERLRSITYLRQDEHYGVCRSAACGGVFGTATATSSPTNGPLSSPCQDTSTHAETQGNQGNQGDQGDYAIMMIREYKGTSNLSSRGEYRVAFSPARRYIYIQTPYFRCKRGKS
jgi:hypothetical protein